MVLRGVRYVIGSVNRGLSRSRFRTVAEFLTPRQPLNDHVFDPGDARQRRVPKLEISHDSHHGDVDTSTV